MLLFDWLVLGQVLPTNPASAVRGPKYVVKRGKTPILTREETRVLLDSIETDMIVGLRDRAILGVLVFSFARVGAALAMTVEDYYPSASMPFEASTKEGGGGKHTLRSFMIPEALA